MDALLYNKFREIVDDKSKSPGLRFLKSGDFVRGGLSNSFSLVSFRKGGFLIVG